jgi:hypothetical protein
VITPVDTASTVRVAPRAASTSDESDVSWIALSVGAGIVSLIAGSVFVVRRRRRGDR